MKNFFEQEMPKNNQLESNEQTIIKSSKDFMLAINAGQLTEAEAYLMAEKENPSQTGHDDHWLVNKLAILLSQYINKKDAAGVERINQLLPENYRRQIL